MYFSLSCLIVYKYFGVIYFHYSDKIVRTGRKRTRNHRRGGYDGGRSGVRKFTSAECARRAGACPAHAYVAKIIKSVGGSDVTRHRMTQNIFRGGLLPYYRVK